MRRNNKSNKYLRTLAMLITYHIVALLMLTSYRLIELAFLHNLITDTSASVSKAFLNGVWFDNVVVCYVMVVPLAVALFTASLGRGGKAMVKIVSIWVTIATCLLMMVSAANTPYFDYFGKNINSSIFEWFGYAGTTAGMVLGEKAWWIHIALYFAMALVFILLMRVLCSLFIRYASKNEMPFFGVFLRRVVITVALVALCIFGIRGRTGYNPIKISEAYYCNDTFLNQLGINPAFNLFTSALDDMRPENEELRLMADNEALTFARADLGAVGKADSMHILRRYVAAHREFKKPNVVIILMESMSANLLNTFGGEKGLTPQLDSLYNHSLAFTNCYSAGIHTNHGITASLYSFPALMSRNLMKGTVTPHLDGIPTVLKQYGYHNMFFMTHESQYDNMKAFLATNGYNDIYSQENYPKDSVVNSFGVSDHFEFNYALGKINEMAAKKKPFFATILTISNHPPYVIPPYFKPKSSEPEKQIVEYADWAISDFIHKAFKRKWFNNTIFVILADHGKRVGNSKAVLSPSYNHIPLIIFGPRIPVMRYNRLAAQVDLMPTLLGLMGMSYTYDGFGYDLMMRPRDAVFYSADNQVVGRGTDKCFIYNPKEDKSFYYHVDNAWNMTEAQVSDEFKKLKNYAFAMEQTTQWMKKRQ